MGLITIELIDDLRSEFGNRNIAYIDEEIYHDAYGFPFLPAWEIRNSLLGIAEEMLTEDEIRGIFGNASQEGSLLMENAVIGSRESMRYALASSSDRRMKNPQLILKQFTKDCKYFAGGEERSCRLLNNGLIFEQCIRLDGKYRSAFEKLVSACESLEHCSGRIRCDLDWELGEDAVYGSGQPGIFWQKTEPGSYDMAEGDGACRMYYSLKLLSPLCVFEPLDITHETKSFIPGELIAKALYPDGNIPEQLRTSFAFCEINGKRGQPVSVAFSTLKTDKSDLRDRLSKGKRPDDHDQLKKISGSYIDGDGYGQITAGSVEMEYGKICLKESGNDLVRSYHAISAEQTMKGFFEGSPECLNAVLERITEDPYLKIGSYTAVGFGSCRIEVEKTECIGRAEDMQEAEEIRVEVLSPVALQQDNGLFTDSAEQFLTEIKRLYQIDDLEITANCKETDMIQGYSREWAEKNALMFLIKGGSSFRIRSKGGMKIPVGSSTVYVGEHTQYGFGELRISPMKDLYYRSLKQIHLDRYDANIQKPADSKPGRTLIREIQAFNVRTLAAALGRIDAENFYESFYQNARDLIEGQLGCEVKEEVVMEHYLKGIQEACEYIRFDKTEKQRS